MNGRHRVSVATHGPLSAHASIHTQLSPSYLDLEDLFSNKYKFVECWMWWVDWNSKTLAKSKTVAARFHRLVPQRYITVNQHNGIDGSTFHTLKCAHQNWIYNFLEIKDSTSMKKQIRA